METQRSAPTVVAVLQGLHGAEGGGEEGVDPFGEGAAGGDERARGAFEGGAAEGVLRGDVEGEEDEVQSAGAEGAGGRVRGQGRGWGRVGTRRGFGRHGRLGMGGGQGVESCGGGGVGVGVEFCQGGDVSWDVHRAAHDEDGFRSHEGLGRVGCCQGEVGERPDGDDRDGVRRVFFQDPEHLEVGGAEAGAEQRRRRVDVHMAFGSRGRRNVCFRRRLGEEALPRFGRC